MMAELFATLPTHDSNGRPLHGRWANLGWAEGLDETLLQALAFARNRSRALVALSQSLVYLDYTLWTGRSAHIRVPSLEHWTRCIENNTVIAFGITGDELAAGSLHGMMNYLYGTLSMASRRQFEQRQQRRADIFRGGNTIELAPLTSPLAYNQESHNEGFHNGNHTLEPLLDLQGNYITSEQRNDPHRVFDPHHPDADDAGFRERSLLKPEIGRRAAAIYGVNRQRWAQLRAF
ncbi:hypothetical protein NBRC10513_007127 [Rhodotorula toruloides]